MTTIIERVRQRKLIPWGLAYLAGGWVLLQVLQFLTETYGWSPVLVRVAPVVLVTGLIVLLILAWYHGERGPQRFGAAEIVAIAITVLLGGAAAVLIARRPASETEANAGAAIAERSVAVLPFVNMSQSAENEYFSDGITEEILNALAKVPGLHVAARTSAFAFKGKNEDIAEIGRKLRVSHVIEGSVQRESGRARITVQLINAKNGYHVWSERYDRELADIFAVEDEIARAVAARLEAHFAPAPQVGRANVGAHNLYLLGMQRWSRRNLDNIQKAIEYFEQAIALDSTYANPHAGLALALAMLPLYDASMQDDWPRIMRTVDRGEAAARKALELDPDLAEARAALGAIYDLRGDFQTAEREIREAIRLNPNYATAHQWLAEGLQTMSRFDEAVREIDRAIQIDPLSPLMHAVRAKILGPIDVNAALRSAEQAMAMDSQFVFVVRDAGFLALEARQFDLAHRILRREFSNLGLDTAAVAVVARGIERPDARAPLLEFLEYAKSRAALGVFVPMLYELAGQRDLAVEYAHVLARATAEQPYLRRRVIEDINRFKTLRSVREDARFPAELREQPRRPPKL